MTARQRFGIVLMVFAVLDKYGTSNLGHVAWAVEFLLGAAAFVLPPAASKPQDAGKDES